MVEMSPYVLDIQECSKRIDLSQLEGSNILITGATGLIGGSLVDVLMNARCQVYALGRNEERAKKRFADYWNSDSFHFIKGDVTKPLSCNINFDYIIHAASNASPNFFKEKPVEVITSNIIGTQNLMEYGLSHGMKRILFVSSGEIYGEGSGKEFVETDSGYVDCATPRACYPSSKRAAETLCVSYAAEYGVDVVIARPCHTYGPFFSESDNRVYAQFIRNVLKGEDIVLKSKGEQLFSYTYVADAVGAMLHVLLHGEEGVAYNIANEACNVRLKDFAQLCAEWADKQVVFELPSETEQKGFSIAMRAVLDNSRLKGLNWHPQYAIKDAVCRTLSILKS